MIFCIRSYFSLVFHVPLVFVSFYLHQIMRFQQCPKIIVLMIVHWLLDFILHVWRHHCHYKVVKSFENVLLFLRIEIEESISILTIDDQLLRRMATKFQYFEKLIVVIFTWEYRYFDKHLDDGACKRPHVYALIIKRYWMSVELWSKVT